MTITELMETRAKTWEQAKAFLEDHRQENGLLTAEDDAIYARLEQEIMDYGKEIERLQRQRRIEQELDRPVNLPITQRPGMDAQPEEKASGRASKAYARDMLTAMRTNFHQVSDLLQEGVDSDGGYLVPEEWDSRLIDVLEEENIFRGLGTKITTSGLHRINIAGTKPAAAWIEEGGALTFGDATFDQITIDAYKLHVAIKITEELLADNAFQLEDYIIAQFGKAIANAEEDAFLNGDGDGKPTGLFADAQVGVTIDTVEIEADDVIDLIYKLKRPYRKKASFIANDSTLAVLRKLKDENGNYLWQPSLQNGEPDRILGYAIRTSQFAPKLAAGKVALAFGDFSYYNIGDRGHRTLQVLKELFAGNGMVGYVMKERVDGLLVLPEAVQVLKVSEG